MSTQNAADQLERYAAMLEKGLLTREEFDAKKKQILGLANDAPKQSPPNQATSSAESETKPAPSNPTVYATTWGFFFVSGPGYWKAKPTYWIGWVCALVMCLLIWPLGIGMFVFLFVASLISRGDWRKNEIQKSIADAAKK